MIDQSGANGLIMKGTAHYEQNRLYEAERNCVGCAVLSLQWVPLSTPLLNGKTWVCRGIPNFLIFGPKHKLWVHVRIASTRRF